MIFYPKKSLSGEVSVPGDKSISHRAIMFGSLAEGTTEIEHFLPGADCLSTISCFRNMGIDIKHTGDTVTVCGNGLYGLKKPSALLDVGNSGTTMRLISGILAAQNFETTLSGDASIRKRPMNRIITPLSLMGASIESLGDDECSDLSVRKGLAPLRICGKKLHGIDYTSPVASAQIKSSILLAGLYAEGTTSVTEPYVSRNHTEIMLKSFGASVSTENTKAIIKPATKLTASKIFVPGDISSAAYFIAAALIVPNSCVVLKNVGINPTRDGILRVCKEMGADIKIEPIENLDGETFADLIIRSSNLHGTTIGGALIPTLIDELPILAVLACFADGETIIKDAAELKVKESNRIDVMVNNLSKMGADVTATDDGMIIHGGKPLHGATIDSHADHRIAMSFAIASFMAEGPTEILGAECVNISYPEFFQDLAALG